MIDPLHSLAFSIQSNRGVYAVLLGSGISRSAKVPTGWEITLDLIRKLASVSEQDCDASPEQWYQDIFGKYPDYSELLDSLARTPAERQQLLRGYLEATAEEREEGLKEPTKAHRAIADLVARGFIKVIITTNFDRLMETALVDVGIAPTILSTVDQVHGALPLIHTRCCIVKVHGDYLDTRIRNTPDELASYPEEFDSLLDRIFDEFGLIVCGWSADWDAALRTALLRAPSRRFSTYWAVRGEPGEPAARLIRHRAAQIVTIKDADTFFSTVQQHIQSLEQLSRPHPLSTEIAVASFKRYLSEPKYRIQLEELISTEVQNVLEVTSGARFTMGGGTALSSESMTSRVRAYEAACTTLLALAVHAGYWAERPQFRVWQQMLSVLATRREVAGMTVWLELQRYPATILLYALGIGAVASDKVEFLAKLLRTTVPSETSGDRPAVQVLPPFRLFNNMDIPKHLEGMRNAFAPLNVWMYETLKPFGRKVLPSEIDYARAFDKLEVLIALAYRRQTAPVMVPNWVPLGRFGYEHGNRERVLNEVNDSLSTQGDASPYVKYDLFGATDVKAREVLASFDQFMIEVKKAWL